MIWYREPHLSPAIANSVGCISRSVASYYVIYHLLIRVARIRLTAVGTEFVFWRCVRRRRCVTIRIQQK